VSLVPASQVMGMPMIVGAHTSDEVQLALEWASDSIESYCERKFAYIESDTVFINPFRGDGGKEMALLPNPPITNVFSVQANMPINGGLTWTQLQYYGWAEDGLLYNTARYFGYYGVTGSSFWSGVANADGFFDYGTVPTWPTLPRSLQVNYAHGYSIPGSESNAPSSVPPLPQGIISAVIRGAALFLDSPNSVTDLGIGDVRQKFDPTGPAGWLDEKLLGEYRLVHL
jgi:hypothetical protein